MFIHLRLHTEFSITDGLCRIPDVVAAAAADGQGALAITDLATLFGGIKFYKECLDAGVKPILGAEVLVQGLGGEPKHVSRLLLLVQNSGGYLNLSQLLTRAWTENAHSGQPLLHWDWLQALSGGLILLSGAQAGPVGQALLQGDEGRASQLALQLASAFPHRFYLELQRAGRADDATHVNQAVQLAARLQLPVVATQPVQFLRADEYEAHEARVCIAEGEMLGNPRRQRRYTDEQYFKTSAQMQALFADVPSALANTVEIARRCSLTLNLGKPQLPHYPTPGGMPIADYFVEASAQGLTERLLQRFPDAELRQAEEPKYRERLNFEIETIQRMGFPGYFLIVADFINWARNNGCPVGPGRGSGAGSLVAYALKITDLDPLQYHLLFERFLNPERVSMPDFDIDFCQGNRDRVIDYVKSKYGKEAVSQIATFGSMAARAVVRDVGRVLDMSYTFCDGISKLIPNKPGTHITLKQAAEQEPQLAARLQNEEEVRTLFELAQKLEGLTRNVGMHAGGVLIAPGKLTDFCPLYQQPGSDAAVSQYDKDDVEAAGLVKFDFLGLATLTILELAKDMIVARHPGQKDFAYERVPLDDERVYRLFGEGKTEAVFQFESRGMQGMLRDAQPSRLEDLIALNALFRPGPMDLIPSFVARKHGREEVSYPHPLVESVLAETYGIMVYQEQVMQTAQVLGGYTLGGADLLRRAMGKKKAEEMAEHRDIFRKGAAQNGIEASQADEIFDLMEKFAGYGFNKSHAAAYSLLAYHTAWLKVHYTAEFFSANMTIEMDDTDKLKALYEDALQFGIQFDQPDINRSIYRFEPISDQRIVYGLGAIKGTGEQAIAAILKAREEGGAFTSLFDFCTRVERQRINKRTVEALIKGGAFDSVQRNRAALLAAVDLAFEYAQVQEANKHQVGLFDMGDAAGHGSSSQEPELPQVLPWGVRERLMQEKTAIGFFISGHLFEESEAEVRQFVRTPLAELQGQKESQVFAGIVQDLRTITTQKGQRLVLFKLDDKSAAIEVSLAAQVSASSNGSASELLADDALVVIVGTAKFDRFSGGLRIKASEVLDLPAARCRYAQALRIDVQEAPRLDIEALIKAHPARRVQTEYGAVDKGLKVQLCVRSEGLLGEAAIVQLPLESAPHEREQRLRVKALVQLGDEMRVYPSESALAQWRAAAGHDKVELVWGQ